MFLPFLHELRSRKVPVGPHEAIALGEALSRGLHESSLDGFYQVARALLVHTEAHLDAFDQAFAHHFKGVEAAGLDLTQQLLDWLKEARARRSALTPEEAALLDQLDRQTLEERFRERLREQRERHDGGSKHIGTGGTSPFGHSGHARDGIRVGGSGGNRRAVQVAQARAFREYRNDAVLDTRQLGVALRKLRAFAREGAPLELDLDGTLAATSRNGGELEIVTRAPRRPNTRLILLLDVGGSMDPYAEQVSLLFSAASKATHFKDLRIYYFHNCVHGQVYATHRLTGALAVDDLISQLDRRYKLIVVGDGLMAPHELMEPTDSSGWFDRDGVEGIAGLMKLARSYPCSAWLNPAPPGAWRRTTIEIIARVFAMFPLTLEGLGEAVGRLTSARSA